MGALAQDGGAPPAVHLITRAELCPYSGEKNLSNAEAALPIATCLSHSTQIMTSHQKLTHLGASAI